MFDEVDEGTAMFKAASQKSDIPVDKQFLYLSIDGINLPSDYYLQLASDLSNGFKQPTSDKLSSTGVLKQATCLRSASNVYRACMQGDGNLVISFQSNNTVRWALGPSSSSGPFQLVMQGDGNVVIYNGSGKPIWASANDPTWSALLSTSTGPYQLSIQDDGDLVARDKNMLIVFSALQTPIIGVNKTNVTSSHRSKLLAS
ncbi:hypothetical protein O6H91_06G081500 [Diphasiastrum complanatum]|nr:hypothetical protein O6H91_06G081500 [Diphasiastrum complanatum]